MSGSATTVLAELTRRGVELAVVGDRLRYRPVGAVTDELRVAMVACRQELLALARSMVMPSMPAGTWARRAATLLARVTDAEERVDLRETFEERAGVCEYDGHLSRDEAERIAFGQLCKVMARAVKGACGEAATQPANTSGGAGR